MLPELPDHDVTLAQRYRELPDPPATPELDARILHAAAQAITPHPAIIQRMAANQPTWKPRNGGQRFAGMAASVMIIGLTGLLLKMGIATKMIEVIHKDVEAQIIEEVKPPPPPDVPPPPPPPLDVPPPPSFIPPPEVAVQPPPVQQPTIQATTAAKPEGPPPAPRAAPTESAPPPPPTAPAKTVSAAECPNIADVGQYAVDEWEKIAEKEGLDKGSLTVEFVIGANGEVKADTIKVTNLSHPSLARLAPKIVVRMKCKGQGVEVKAKYPVAFKLE